MFIQAPVTVFYRLLVCQMSKERTLIHWLFFCFWRSGPHWAMAPQWAMASSFTRFLDHTQWRTTVGRTPLEEWSARRRDLYLTTHNTHNRQTSMLPVGFEPTISAGERPQIYVLFRAATGTGSSLIFTILNWQKIVHLTWNYVTFSVTSVWIDLPAIIWVGLNLHLIRHLIFLTLIPRGNKKCHLPKHEGSNYPFQPCIVLFVRLTRNSHYCSVQFSPIGFCNGGRFRSLWSTIEAFIAL